MLKNLFLVFASLICSLAGASNSLCGSNRLFVFLAADTNFADNLIVAASAYGMIRDRLGGSLEWSLIISCYSAAFELFDQVALENSCIFIDESGGQDFSSSLLSGSNPAFYTLEQSNDIAKYTKNCLYQNDKQLLPIVVSSSDATWNDLGDAIIAYMQQMALIGDSNVARNIILPFPYDWKILPGLLESVLIDNFPFSANAISQAISAIESVYGASTNFDAVAVGMQIDKYCNRDDFVPNLVGCTITESQVNDIFSMLGWSFAETHSTGLYQVTPFVPNAMTYDETLLGPTYAETGLSLSGLQQNMIETLIAILSEHYIGVEWSSSAKVVVVYRIGLVKTNHFLISVPNGLPNNGFQTLTQEKQ